MLGLTRMCLKFNKITYLIIYDEWSYYICL